MDDGWMSRRTLQIMCADAHWLLLVEALLPQEPAEVQLTTPDAQNPISLVGNKKLAPSSQQIECSQISSECRRVSR